MLSGMGGIGGTSAQPSTIGQSLPAAGSGAVTSATSSTAITPGGTVGSSVNNAAPRTNEAVAANASATAPANASAVASAVSGPVSNPYPFAQGDSFQYAYAASRSSERVGKPLNKTTTSGTLVTTIGGMVSFGGQQLVDVKQVLSYTDADASQKTTAAGTTSSDRYETFAQAGNGGLLYQTYGGAISGKSSNSAGDSLVSASTTTYAGPYVLDQLPEAKKATWNDLLGYTLTAQTQATASGLTTTGQSTYTRNADGSYTRSTTHTPAGGATLTLAESQSAGGSGQEQSSGNQATAATTTFSAPAQVNGAYVITVVRTPASGAAVTTTVPDWFPGNAAAPPLATDQRIDLGQTAVPAKCGSTAGQNAMKLRELMTELDVVRGTYSSEVVDSFVVAGEGVVCIDHQRLTQAYDNRATGKLVSVERFNETIGLSGETLKQARAK
jgi:hypothetical protein